jgi:hypothetical protein
MTDLAAGHGDQPAYEDRGDRVAEYQHVSAKKTRGADEVQRLIDPTVVIIAVIIPPLFLQSSKKIAHLLSLLEAVRCCYCDSMKGM